MRPLRDIYSQLVSTENLYRAAHRAALGKRYRDSSAEFTFRLEEGVEKLHHEFTTKTYRHGEYRLFTVYDPKKRDVAAAPFRDRVVHHALHDVIEPMIDPTFIYDSYACRRGKGTHAALDRAQQFLRANRWCLYGDIRKYFPSIDHGILKSLLRKYIADEDALWLADSLIDSGSSFTIHHPPSTIHFKGLPIGNLTSQFFANLYLNELDYFIKFKLRLRYYIRYMDDFLVFADDKDRLYKIRNAVRDFLNGRLAVNLHEGKSQVHDTRAGLTFLGFRLFRHYRRLATANVRRLRRRLKQFSSALRRGTIGRDSVRLSLQCWRAHAAHADTGGLQRTMKICLL